MVRRCVAVLGGSFDPIHNGHVALAEFFIDLLKPDELRIIPAGNPWQKGSLHAPPEDRMEMARRAFDRLSIPITIDRQEIQRHSPTYTIDTLRALRTELGPDTSLAFLIGADQLQQLHTWHEWRHLFDYAHICAASRPGFTLDMAHLPDAVAQELARRNGTPAQIRSAPHGCACLVSGLSVDISATQIRTALRDGDQLQKLLPPRVLDYIKQHHLYRN